MIYLFLSVIGSYVSLPGAGINDQETIIQVFNPVNANENEKLTANRSELERTGINSEIVISDDKDIKTAKNRARVTASENAFVKANNRTNLTEENKDAVKVNYYGNLTEINNASAGLISNNNKTAGENSSEDLTEKSCSAFSKKNNGILEKSKNEVIEKNNNNEILIENNCSDFREIDKNTLTPNSILSTNIDRNNSELLLEVEQNCNNRSFDVTDNAQFSINVNLVDPSVKRNHIESDNLVSSYLKEITYSPTISFNKLNLEIPSLPTTTATNPTPTTPSSSTPQPTTATTTTTRPPTATPSNSKPITTPTSSTPSSAGAEKLPEYSSNEQTNGNVFHIESHLIETYDDHVRTSEDGVGISELPPLKEELTKGPSKIETDGNVRTVIEVEPAGSKIIIKPVQTLLQQQKSQKITESINPIESSKSKTELKNKPEFTSKPFNFQSDENIEKIAKELVLEIEENASKAAVYTERNKTEQLGDLEKDTTDRTIKKQPQTLPILSQKNTEESLLPKAELDSKLSQEVDEQLSEITTILREKSVANYSNGVVEPDESVKVSSISVENRTSGKNAEQIKIVELSDLPAPNNASEEEERKLFIDSLPQISEVPKAGTVSDLTTAQKREYYRTLRKYLAQQNSERPPIPLQTYRWEDLRRAKERGGYPWTHLYKRPLGPDEEPEIVLLLRKSQELRFTSESPKSLKKVHYDEQVLVTETEPYINEIAEDEDNSAQAESEPPEPEPENSSVRSESFSCLSDSILAAEKPHKSKRIDKIRGFLRRRRRSGRFAEDAQSLPGTSVNNSRHHSEENINTESHESERNGTNQKEVTREEGLKKQRCFPIMKKLKNMADRQKKRMNIKRIALKKGERIVFGDETKIMNLKSSPKSDRNEIPHFIEKQDSDDVLEIVQLDESPSRKHKCSQGGSNEVEQLHERSVVEPDEISEIAREIKTETVKNTEAPEASVSKVPEDQTTTQTSGDLPPRKTPRLRREHVYEEIDQSDVSAEPLSELLDMGGSVEALKSSLTKQDDSLIKDFETADGSSPLDRMGSSDEEQLTGSDGNAKSIPLGLLAPISSIDSASSEEDRGKVHLAAVAEESDVASTDGLKSSIEERPNNELTTNTHEEKNEIANNKEVKSSIKKEASPAPSDKKVTFSTYEHDNEPHREDIELPEGVRETRDNRWKNMR